MHAPVAARGAKPVHEAPFTLMKDEGLRIDLVLQWTEATDEHIRSYVNGIPTGSGGTHENGLRTGIGKAMGWRDIDVQKKTERRTVSHAHRRRRRTGDATQR